MKVKWVLWIALLTCLLAIDTRAEDVVGNPITPWQPGMLDIHQISSGRGNAGLYIFPDGTTLLVDAGELPLKTPKHTADRPDSSRLPANGSCATFATRCATIRTPPWTTRCSRTSTKTTWARRPTLRPRRHPALTS